MEEKINYGLKSKKELQDLTLEQLKQAKEYYEKAKEYSESLKKGIDYDGQLDYDVHNDIKDYNERIQIVDDLIERKK